MRGQHRFAARVLGALGVLALALLGAAAPARAQDGPTNDPGSRFQWHLDAIGAPTAWAASTGKGATIAVVDTGIDLDHEDLQADGKIAGAASCIGTDGDPSRCTTGGHDDGRDDDGHGTHVAGIAAASTGNAIGVAGVAPDAQILAVKVLTESCGGLLSSTCDARGTADDVVAGIEWAIAHGATVINLSLGSTSESVFGPAFAQAIEDAWNAGVIPVVAAGNDFILGSGFSNNHAIVVGALNRAGAEASYSSGVGSARWGISAPGGESDDSGSCETAPRGILSTYWVSGSSNSYACLAGTSMAAPQVAGAAAILRSAGLSAQDTVDRLLGTARDIGPTGNDSTYGAGALDLVAATAGLQTTADSASAPVTTHDSTTEPPTSANAAPATVSLPASGPTTTTSAPVVELPTTVPSASRTQQAVGVSQPAAPDNDVPPLALSAAVLLAGGVGTASGWMLVRGAGWARRTPPL
jgi:subtilisin family serine protease